MNGLPTNEPAQLSKRRGFTGAAPVATGGQTHSEWVLRPEVQDPGQDRSKDHSDGLDWGGRVGWIT